MHLCSLALQYSQLTESQLRYSRSSEMSTLCSSLAPFLSNHNPKAALHRMNVTCFKTTCDFLLDCWSLTLCDGSFHYSGSILEIGSVHSH